MHSFKTLTLCSLLQEICHHLISKQIDLSLVAYGICLIKREIKSVIFLFKDRFKSMSLLIFYLKINSILQEIYI